MADPAGRDSEAHSHSSSAESDNEHPPYQAYGNGRPAARPSTRGGRRGPLRARHAADGRQQQQPRQSAPTTGAGREDVQRARGSRLNPRHAKPGGRIPRPSLSPMRTSGSEYSSSDGESDDASPRPGPGMAESSSNQYARTFSPPAAPREPISSAPGGRIRAGTGPPTPQSRPKHRQSGIPRRVESGSSLRSPAQPPTPPARTHSETSSGGSNNTITQSAFDARSSIPQRRRPPIRAQMAGEPRPPPASNTGAARINPRSSILELIEEPSASDTESSDDGSDHDETQAQQRSPAAPAASVPQSPARAPSPSLLSVGGPSQIPSLSFQPRPADVYLRSPDFYHGTQHRDAWAQHAQFNSDSGISVRDSSPEEHDGARGKGQFPEPGAVPDPFQYAQHSDEEEESDEDRRDSIRKEDGPGEDEHSSDESGSGPEGEEPRHAGRLALERHRQPHGMSGPSTRPDAHEDPILHQLQAREDDMRHHARQGAPPPHDMYYYHNPPISSPPPPPLLEPHPQHPLPGGGNPFYAPAPAGGPAPGVPPGPQSGGHPRQGAPPFAGYLPSSHGPDRSRTTVVGYELVASKLSEHAGAAGGRQSPQVLPIYRKFEHLNHRILLHLQDEIAEFEEELRMLDECIAQAGGFGEDRRPLASRRTEARYGNELHFARTELLGKIFMKLNQYNQAMSSYAEMIKDMEPARPEDVHTYQQWMYNNAPVEQSEARFLEHRGDLVCLVSRRAKSSAKQPKVPTPPPVAITTTAMPQPVVPVPSAVPSAKGQDIGGIPTAYISLPLLVLLPLVTFPLFPWFLIRLFIILVVAVGEIATIANTNLGGLLTSRDWGLCGGVYFAMMVLLAAAV